MKIDWQAINTLPSKSYKCGYCGQPLASQKGWLAVDRNTNKGVFYIYVCHHCDKPTFFDFNLAQTPGVIFGNDVEDISDKKVADLYDEARKCTNNNAFTAAVLSCRKLLMHIAVSKGAAEGLKFIEYVQYLSDKNFIPPDAKEWVDIIREKGNEANHEITIMSEDDAKDLITFSEMLLKLIYEFPANVKKKKVAIT
jgi:hypothetical protein